MAEQRQDSSIDLDARRFRLANLCAAEIAEAFEGARLQMEHPVVFVVQQEDPLATLIAGTGKSRPKKWRRRASQLQADALRSEYEILVHDYSTTLEILGDAVRLKLGEEGGDFLRIVVVAYGGISCCFMDA